jgi:eukaryotic-like serine/threonine-protein kinase
MVEVGETINAKYRILRLIGDGGMGSVYEARHELLGSNVALKFLHPEIAEQESLKQRFLQEARVSSSIRNPHIVRTLDVDSYSGGAFLVMELLEGEPLSNLLEREHALLQDTALRYALQLLDGVAAAHAIGVTHRDLKPDNIFVTQLATEPLIKILDFGIAKLRQSSEYKMTLTRPGSVMGTPEYMAPEQAFSADLADSRSDVYSIGVILFEMLSGHRPVQGDNPQHIAEQILTGKVLRLDVLCPELPPGLVNVVHVAMSADPEQRWTDAAALRNALLPFVTPLERSGSSHALIGSSVPFQVISRTPRIDGTRNPVERVGVETRVERARPVEAPAVSTPAREVVQKTAPPDSRPPPGAVGIAAARTVGMAESSFPAKGGPLASGPAGRTRAPRERRSGGSGRRWLVAVGFLSLLVGAGVVVQFTLHPQIETPPRPTRRVPGPPVEAQQSALMDEGIEEEDIDEEIASQESEPERPRPNVASQPAAPPIPSVLPPSMATVVSSPTVASTPMVTIPAIQLPSLPTVLMLPTSLPPGLPTVLPFPLPQPGAKP